MTLIAATTNDNFPIIIGDIMVSSQVDVSVNLPTIPTNIDPYLDKGLSSKPSGFYQKVYVINKKIAVALAGDVVEMRWFLKELRIRCAYYDQINLDIVKAFFKDISISSRTGKIAFLLLWMEEGQNGMISPMQVWAPQNFWRQSESEILGDVFACGSGAGSFLNWVTGSKSWEFSDKDWIVRKAVTQNMIFLATILASERTSLYNVNELWGAGFEIINYSMEGFVKLDKHAFLLIEGTVDENGDLSILTPKMVQFYEYHDEILWIIAVEIGAPEIAEIDIKQITTSGDNLVNITHVPPLDKIVELDNNYTLGNVSTSKLAIGYSIIINEHYATFPGLFFEGEDALVSFNNGRIEVELPIDITERMRIEILNGIRTK